MFDSAEALQQFRRLIDEWHERLTALDELAGDGDFGANIRLGMEKVTDAVAREQGSVPPFRSAANVFLDDVGGTSGPLFGLLFMAIADALEKEESLDALRSGAAAGLAAIQRVGGAEPGDRTLVDALAPAVDALGGGDLAAAAGAAIEGAIASARYQARMGRASYVGQRVVGSPDPGAVAIALFSIAAARAASFTVDIGPLENCMP